MESQVKFQKRQFSLFVLPGPWAPLGRAVHRGMDRAVLWQGSTVPHVLPLGSSPSAVATPRVGVGIQPASGDRLTQPFYSLLQGSCSCWASLASVRSLSAEVSLLLILGVLLCNDQASAGSDSSSPLGGWPPFNLRWFFKENITSLTNSTVHSGPQWGPW